MTQKFGYLGAIDIDPANVTVDGEPAGYTPSLELAWANELKADDGAWRFLKGGNALAPNGNLFNYAKNFTVIALLRQNGPSTFPTTVGKYQGNNGYKCVSAAGTNTFSTYCFLNNINYVPAVPVKEDKNLSADRQWHWQSWRFSDKCYMLSDVGISSQTVAIPQDVTNSLGIFTITASQQPNVACVLIYNRPLSDTEVQNIMLGKTMPRSVSGLQGYYKFNEGVSKGSLDCKDYSGQGNHLTYSAPVWETYNPGPTYISNYSWSGTLGAWGGKLVTVGESVFGDTLEVSYKLDSITASQVCVHIADASKRAAVTSNRSVADSGVVTETVTLNQGPFNLNPFGIQITNNSATPTTVSISGFAVKRISRKNESISGQSGQPYVGRQLVNPANGWERRTPAYLDYERQGSFLAGGAGQGTTATIGAGVLSSAVTVSGWVNPQRTNTATDAPLLGVNGNEVRFGVQQMGKSIVLYKNGIGGGLTPPKPIPMNKWTHIAITADASAIANVYVNGLYAGSIGNMPLGNFAGGSGALQFGSNSASRIQSIRSLRLFNRVLSADEIDQLYLTDKYSGAMTSKTHGGNYLLWSSDISQSAWICNNGTKLSGNTFTLALTNSTSYLRQVVSGIPASATTTMSFTASAAVAGAIKVRLSNGVDQTNGDQTVNITTTPARYSVTFTFNATVPATAYVHVHTFDPNLVGQVLTITDVQYEISSSAGTYLPTTTAIIPQSYSEGLVGEWLCNEPSLGYIKDTGPFGLHSTNLSAGNIMVTDSPYVMSRKKRKGFQANFSTGSSRLELQSVEIDQKLEGAKAICIAGWVKQSVPCVSSSTAIGIQNGGSTAACLLSWGAGDLPAIYARSRSTEIAGAANLFAPVAQSRVFQQWRLMAVEADYENSKMRIYINGNKVAEFAKTFDSQTYNDANPGFMKILLGANGGQPFKADDVRIYNRALSAQEHRKLFADIPPKDIASAIYENNVHPNGGPFSNYIGWNPINSTVTVENNNLKILSGASAGRIEYVLNNGIEAGATYRIMATGYAQSGDTLSVQAFEGTGTTVLNSGAATVSTNSTSLTSIQLYATATGNSISLKVRSSIAGSAVYLSTLSIQKVTTKTGLVAEYLFDGGTDVALAPSVGGSSPWVTFNTAGGFSINSDGSIYSSGTATAYSGVIVYLAQPVTAGRRYQLSYDVSSTNNGQIQSQFLSGSNGYVTGSGSRSYVMTAPSNLNSFTLQVGSPVFSGTVKNIVVKDVTDCVNDTSGNGLHLTATGQVTYVREP